MSTDGPGCAKHGNHHCTACQEFDRYQRVYEQNVLLRAALRKLLDLDEQRPADPTWWRKWWDEACAEAEILLGGARPKKKDTRP